MTELHHFHPARKGSGSLRPFPIYPLYTRTVILSLDKPIADCFLFRPRKRLEKGCEKRRKRSHTNAFQYVGHTDFNTFGTNGPRSLSRMKAGTHSAFGEKSHTAAHRGKQEPSLPWPQHGLVLPAKSLLFCHAFICIHFPVLCEPPLLAEGENQAKLPP